MIARRLTVRGRVQGVFYRDWTVANARALGLSGWVRNEADGTVAAHLEGEEGAVRTMISRMDEGPRAARVEHVDAVPASLEGSGDFQRR